MILELMPNHGDRHFSGFRTACGHVEAHRPYRQSALPVHPGGQVRHFPGESSEGGSPP